MLHSGEVEVSGGSDTKDCWDRCLLVAGMNPDRCYYSCGHIVEGENDCVSTCTLYGLTPENCHWVCTGRSWSPDPGLNDIFNL